MNLTGNGRIGRYRREPNTLELQKKCTGRLHPPGGVWLPMTAFFIMKKGPRAGKPIPQCKLCERMRRGGDMPRGWVYSAQVWWIFTELERRIGRMETCRRLDMSLNLWYRHDLGHVTKHRLSTVAKAMRLLREVRAAGEVRHRDSIRHGAAARGRTERQVRGERDYNHAYMDVERDRKRRHRERVATSR